MRDAAGAIERIVEEKDASADERAIDEVNTGLLAMRTAALAQHVAGLDRDNAQGEYYLTDVIAAGARPSGTRRTAAAAPTSREVQGVNNRAQLAAVERDLAAPARRELDGVAASPCATRRGSMSAAV
ncbi:MAG: hypothetical protein U5K43_04890 [Halofilum sp. (in: g-proteobacteria)]|nr:hypothetical protein [Halofilum sp. (in: g-proteobacteria)]